MVVFYFTFYSGYVTILWWAVRTKCEIGQEIHTLIDQVKEEIRKV